MEDDWVRFETPPGPGDRWVWLGNVTKVRPDPILTFTEEYTHALLYEDWTHWKLCRMPEPPRRTPREIALTALQTSRDAGWEDSQLVDAMVSELDKVTPL